MTSGLKVVQVEIEIKTAYLQTMTFTKSISTCDERKMAKEILLKEINLILAKS